MSTPQESPKRPAGILLRLVRGGRRPSPEREPWYVPEITERPASERAPRHAYDDFTDRKKRA